MAVPSPEPPTLMRRRLCGLHCRLPAGLPADDSVRLSALAPCLETPIRPLLDDLDFVENKSQWGYRFRFSVFSIDEHDFGIVRAAMTGRGRRLGASLVG